MNYATKFLHQGGYFKFWYTLALKIFILLVCMSIPTLLVAQTGKYNPNENNTDQTGYIVKDNYDTIEGSIYVTQPHYMEYAIDFKRNSGGNTSIMRPNQLISFATTNSIGKETIWISTTYSVLSHPPQDSYMNNMPDAFLNVVVQGPITVYYYYNYKEDAEVQRTSTLYMVLPNKEVIDASGMMMGFKKKMPEYVKDFPELAKKIASKQDGYKFMQLEKIAEEYNAWYMEKNSEYKFFTIDPPKKSLVKLPEEIIFKTDPIAFQEHPGIKFWLSEPFKRYQKWDTQKTGDAQLSVALKIENKSGKAISKLFPNIKSFDKDGNLMKQLSGGTGPFSFEPNPSKIIPNNYVGIANTFYNDELLNADTFGKVEFTILELGYAHPDATDNPPFKSDWVQFDKCDGYKFRLSEPHIFVDGLSGNNLFGIAMELKNESGKEVKFFNFQVKVYDEQGVVYDEERQNHTGLFDPSVRFGHVFPADYQGLNRNFYTNDEDFIKSFKKIEFSLNSVDY
jgi:hypothetical protein